MKNGLNVDPLTRTHFIRILLSNVRFHSLNSPYGPPYSSLRESANVSVCVCVSVCLGERERVVEGYYFVCHT
jgi:hypothetical protein